MVWSKLVDTASTVSPPRVEDAGNGYLTLPQPLRWARCLHRVWQNRVVEVGKAKASSLGVGYLADAHDNKSVAEIGARHHLLLAGGDLCVVGGLG